MKLFAATMVRFIEPRGANRFVGAAGPHEDSYTHSRQLGRYFWQSISTYHTLT